MSKDNPKTEEERRDYMFAVALGGHIMEGAVEIPGGAARITLPKEQGLLRQFFNYGWSQGLRERSERCQNCHTPTDVYLPPPSD